MANEFVASIGPNQLNPGTESQPAFVSIGFLRARSFAPKVKTVAGAMIRVPNASALTTGLTVNLTVLDDPLNSAAGKVAKFGVSIGPITSGTSTVDDDAVTGPLVSTTEVTGVVTLTAKGVAYNLSIAVAAASMNALAVGGTALIRIRRLGDDAADTHAGRVLLTLVDVRAT